jgi:hypothetical protein
MTMDDLAVQISVIAGAAITLALAYVPGLKDKWGMLEGDQKRLALGILYLAVAAGMYVPSCLGGPALVECSTASIWPSIMAWLMALVGGQSLYAVLPSWKKDEMSVARRREAAEERWIAYVARDAESELE